MKVKLMLDTKKFTNKPSGYETAGVQKRIQQTEIEIEELAFGLCNGMTCKPALLNGTKSTDWVNQQVFMLDFDHDTTINEQLELCETLNILPSFAYTSFSHSEQEHHFRFVFITDKVITCVEERNKLQITLINTFCKSDKVTFDCTRIFYGGNGKQPIQSNYDARIDSDDIINRYYKEEYVISNVKKIPVKPVRTKNVPTKSNKAPISNYDYMENVNAIKSLNVDKLRGLIGELKGVTNKKDINNLILLVTPFSIELHSEQEVYDYINSIDMNTFLGISNGEMIKCILPNHDDSTPSAHIYTTNSGTQVYKCFGCNKSRTLIGLVETLAHCKRSEAIEFIKNVYNIKLVQSDWVLEQKQLMIDSANYLDTEEFTMQFPNLSKLIRTRKHHIQKMLMHFTQYISDDLKYNDKPLFYGSYNQLLDVCNINPNKRITLSQSLTLFALLNMLDKVELNCVPEEELNKAKSISAKYGFNKVTSFYQFEEYGVNLLDESEDRAKLLIDNNFSLKGLSREYILRTFGIELADKIYPQYIYNNAIGTSNKSDKASMKIANKILKSIEKKGYILEKDIKRNNATETQWKRSIQEILDTYNLVKVKASKSNKELYNLPESISYQSHVICKNVE